MAQRVAKWYQMGQGSKFSSEKYMLMADGLLFTGIRCSTRYLMLSCGAIPVGYCDPLGLNDNRNIFARCIIPCLTDHRSITRERFF